MGSEARLIDTCTSLAISQMWEKTQQHKNTNYKAVLGLKKQYGTIEHLKPLGTLVLFLAVLKIILKFSSLV